jgi:hypothetical protein
MHPDSAPRQVAMKILEKVVTLGTIAPFNVARHILDAVGIVRNSNNTVLHSQRWKFRLTHNPCPVSPSSHLGYGRQPNPHRILAASLCKPDSSSKTIWTCWFTKFVKWERWFHAFAQSETSPTNWPTYKTHSSQYPSRDCHAGRWAADAVARNGWWSGAGCCFQIWALPLPSRPSRAKSCKAN